MSRRRGPLSSRSLQSASNTSQIPASTQSKALSRSRGRPADDSSTSLSMETSSSQNNTKITEAEIAEMWSRANGTYVYPTFDHLGNERPQSKLGVGLSKSGLARHANAADRKATERKEYMRKLARRDKEEREALASRSEHEQHSGGIQHNEAKGSSILRPPWGDFEE